VIIYFLTLFFLFQVVKFINNLFLKDKEKEMEKIKIRRKNKRGQGIMSLPFGIIFSIMMIIFFIVIAFIAIKQFLSIKTCTSIGMFYDDLQREVQSAYQSSGYKKDFTISLPSGVEKVCFANMTQPLKGRESEVYEEIKIYKHYNANTFLLPIGEACEMPYKETKYLNVAAITTSKNPYCVPAKGKIIVEFKIYDKSVILR